MSRNTPQQAPWWRRSRAALYAALAIAAGLAAVAVVFVLGGDGDEPAAPKRTLTAAELLSRVRASNAPVFWVGPRASHRYELTTRAGGAAFVRYVPPGGEGAENRSTLTVATYPGANALADVRAASRRENAATIALPNGGLGTYERDRPSNVFVAYPGVAAQIEVFDPEPAAARRAVRRGLVQPIAAVTAAVAQPFVGNASDLRAFAAGLRPAPIYWAGPRHGVRYEVTRTGDGALYVRYLPPGVEPGDPRGGLLTVATYPRSNALAEVRAAAKRPGAESFDVAPGGLAVHDRGSPGNVHLAFPGVDRQIEAYGQQKEVAALVRGGAIEPVR